MLDILIYLFETYVNSDIERTEPDRDSLKDELTMAGFADRDIDGAFRWLESLASMPVSVPHSESRALRVFDSGENARLDVSCRGYIQHLETLGILSAMQREWVIDRLLAMPSDDLADEEIDIEQVKWVVLMVLFSQPGEATAYSRMEDLVLAELGGSAVH